MSEVDRPPRPYGARVSAAAVLDRLAASSSTPVSAMIEIADRCNEACVHCYQVQGQKGEMSTLEIERVMDDLASLGVLMLTLSGGEATLRKDFLHLVAYARKLRFAVKIYSNALRIDERLASELGRLAVQEVQISLYSARAEVHDWVTRVPGAFDKVVAAVGYLRRAGVAVVLKTPLMSFNANETDAYVALARSLDADYAFDTTLHSREDGDLTPPALAASEEDYVRLQANLSGPGPEPAGRALEGSPCGACRGSVHVEADGMLQPCTLWTLPTGNAREEGVAAAWRGNPRARAIRQLTWSTLPACRQCDLRPYCGRCFAEASRYAGNALLPYAQACEQALVAYQAVRGVRPDLSPGNGRSDTRLGPYRKLGEHRFEAGCFELDDEDRRRLSEHPWIGATHSGSARPAVAMPAPAVPGQLVQLRRPGRKTLTERLPRPSSPVHVT